MVKVFREVWRVLKDDGVLWLNLGDSYAGSGCGWGGGSISEKTNHHSKIHGHEKERLSKDQTPPSGMKRKDLVGIPWMVAFALRSDGWYLRQDIIWHKPNPMPESVTDRCTKSHEYIFLLTKNARYYYDHEAIKEPCATPIDSKARCGFGSLSGKSNTMEYSHSNETGKKWEKTTHRNRRSVWTITTKPYKGSHFATFPPDLVEPMVLAGSREGDIVLDPFSGTSTVGQVAHKHKRKYVGTELSFEYIQLAQKRLRAVDVALF